MVLPPEKEHCLRIVEQVHHFLTQESLCDLTIFIEQEEFHLHRCIFAAMCPLLYNLITKATEGTPLSNLKLKLHGITTTAFRSLVDFIYTGKAPDECQTELRIEFVKVCCNLKVPFPRSTAGQTIWLTPKDDVQIVLLPKNESGVIEVILQQFEKDVLQCQEMPSLDEVTIGEEVVDTPDNGNEETSNHEISAPDNESHHAVVGLLQEDDMEDMSADLSTISDHDYSFPADVPGTQLAKIHSTNSSNTTFADCQVDTNVSDELLKKSFKCRKCQAILPEISSPISSQLVTDCREIRYNCKPCGKWYITLRGKGSLTPSLLKSKRMMHNFVASVNGHAQTPLKGRTALSKPASRIVKHYQYRCNQCYSIFNRKGSLTEHIKDKHDATSTSNESNETYTGQPAENTNDPVKPEKERPFRCVQCGHRFTRKSSLTEHVRLLHSNVRQIVFCEVCKRKYSGVKSFNIHVKKNHPNGDVPTLCPPARPRQIKPRIIKTEKATPKKVTPSKKENEKLSRYGKKTRKTTDGMPHDQQSPFYECCLCLAKYKKQKSFLVHIEKCKILTKYRCNQCPQGFRSKKKRAEHLSSAHQYDEMNQTNNQWEDQEENNSQWYSQTDGQVEIDQLDTDSD